MSSDRCPDCDGELKGGPCPRCLLRLGIDRPGPSPGPPGETLDLPPRSASVLETIYGSTDGAPRVLLRETTLGEESSPVLLTASGYEAATRYRIDGEIARGGMGAILKGRDPDLGRDVAIKVLREDHRDNADMVRRFIEEAQISGQLQHPGIAPIYELGAFGDRRPFFSMKLVKGQTLAKLLEERKSTADGLPRFLGIFESIAQTVAYAHARGVIHRDLKPSNVMVGSFGEVQVMDWGLAKVLPRGGLEDDAEAGKVAPEETVIATARSGADDSDLSHAGSVMGTPSYMAPEQARGEIDRIDERADVFALGSILCEVLTGRPVFVGRSSAEIQRKAARGELADALARLNACGADAELISLTRECLAPERDGRPRNAGEVAGRITAYTAGIQERAQLAERERAVAVARAVEERRRRKVQLSLAASVLALVTLGGLSTTYYVQQRQARILAFARAAGRVITLRDQALEHPEDPARWELALTAIEQAEAAGQEEAIARLRVLRSQILSGLDSARRDRELLERLVDIRSAKVIDERLDDFRSVQAPSTDGSDTEAAYAQAFSGGGLDIATLSTTEAGARIRTRPSIVKLTLATALDDWAAVRRNLQNDPTGADRLIEVARLADPDPWRNSLRAALTLRDEAGRKKALAALAASANFEELGAISLDLLGLGLAAVDDLKTAEIVLRRSVRHHPGDVWINFDLARVLQLLSRRDEAIRFFQVARALRPETAFGLSEALAAKGETDESIEILRDLSRLRPRNFHYPLSLGSRLSSQGRKKEADLAYDRTVVLSRESLRLRPDDPYASFHLGVALLLLQKPDEAIAVLREAIRLRPDDALNRFAYGGVLFNQGKFDDAVVASREYIRRSPRSIRAYGFLGICLRAQGKPDEAITVLREANRLKPDESNLHQGLGDALNDRGQREEAVAEYREAIRLKPDNAEAHSGLGFVLRVQGKREEAIAEYREAIRLKPDHDGAHSGLGVALQESGNLDGAIAEFREAIRIRPVSSYAHFSLGFCLFSQNQKEEAVAEIRESIRHDPKAAAAHQVLGLILTDQKKYDEAATAFRESIRLKPGDPIIHYYLGNVLRDQGKLDEAVVAYREAVRFDAAKGHIGDALDGLVKSLEALGKHDDVIAAYRELIRLDTGAKLLPQLVGKLVEAQQWGDVATLSLLAVERSPDDPSLIHRVALAQLLSGDREGYRRTCGRAMERLGRSEDRLVGEAARACLIGPDPGADLAVPIRLARFAAKREPKAPWWQYVLGLSCYRSGEFERAIESLDESGQVDPGWDATSLNWPVLAMAHHRLGHGTEAREWLTRARDARGDRSRGIPAATSRSPWHDRAEFGLLLREAEELIDGRSTDPAIRLPAVLRGDVPTGNAAESACLAYAAADKSMYATSARFFAEAFAADPEIAEAPKADNRYHAACSAALAAAGRGKDEPPPEDAARAKLRRLALDWLKSELDRWTKNLASASPESRPAIANSLKHRRQVADLATLRDPDHLTRLPEPERTEWKAFWSEVDVLIKRAEGKAP